MITSKSTQSRAFESRTRERVVARVGGSGPPYVQHILLSSETFRTIKLSIFLLNGLDTEPRTVMVVVDVAKMLYASRTLSDDYLLERLQKYSIPGTLMDLLTNKADAESVAKKFNEKYPYFKKTLFVSALEKTDLAEIKDVLFAEALPRDWLFPADQTSEMSDLHLVEDFIRAEFFKRLHQYLPYLLKQENVGWTELPDGTLRIDQTVYVERESQRKIVVGTNGVVINGVVKDATREIRKALGRCVTLFIQVKNREN
ncbi:prokaryotic type K homology domain-containing protein [Endogone sp. FLAS-F59071]|nr:prokaryotic type K homology domain-containing protein [Endogone sp. FLAS-F59071]|eukprot:RUS17320.1 prokaryotic type K homology domain-containing protein [Endogone sp. FLAS-F59071]